MIRFKVEPDGAGERGEPTSFEVEAGSRDIIEWEVRKQGRHLGMLQATPRMTDLVELAWLTCRRTKEWTGDLSDFRRYVEVTPLAQPDDGEADDLLDPTQPSR
jgi:hypothetical protein